MNLTIDDILSAVQAEGTEKAQKAARCMRLLGDDLVVLLREGNCPIGDDGVLTWRHPCGCVCEITEGSEDDEEAAMNATDYTAIICYQDEVIAGGFALHDDDIADLLDAHIENNFEGL
jgi:hypothetical protein